jgi:hypothetical protein
VPLLSVVRGIPHNRSASSARNWWLVVYCYSNICYGRRRRSRLAACNTSLGQIIAGFLQHALWNLEHFLLQRTGPDHSGAVRVCEARMLVELRFGKVQKRCRAFSVDQYKSPCISACRRWLACSSQARPSMLECTQTPAQASCSTGHSTPLARQPTTPASMAL